MRILHNTGKNYSIRDAPTKDIEHLCQSFGVGVLLCRFMNPSTHSRAWWYGSKHAITQALLSLHLDYAQSHSKAPMPDRVASCHRVPNAAALPWKNQTAPQTALASCPLWRARPSHPRIWADAP